MRIAIAALAKSGSTLLYDRIKRALTTTGPYLFHFEPQNENEVQFYEAPVRASNVLVKIMLSRMVVTASDLLYGTFEKRVLLQRDLRDIAVSTLLFRPMMSTYPTEVVDSFVDAVKRKERDPSSISVVGLHRMADELGIGECKWGGLLNDVERLLELRQRYECCVIKYEDYGARADRDLSRYLKVECSLRQGTAFDNIEHTWLRHIRRGGGSGQWRNWFTDEDTQFFRAMFGSQQKALGYDPDEKPCSRPYIDPANASGYIRRRFPGRQRDFAALAADLEEGVDISDEEIRIIMSSAQDGANWSAVLLSKLLRYHGAKVEAYIARDAVHSLLLTAASKGSPEAEHELRLW